MQQHHPMLWLASTNAAHAISLDDSERLARLAARRAFVELKQAFMRAAALIEGEIGARLQRRVRRATEAVELWRLRAVVLASLPETDAAHVSRIELSRQLDSVFPEGAG